MVIRMRHTRAHTANRRSHHALTAPRLSKCPNCGSMHRMHRACASCGQYRGKEVAPLVAAIDKRAKRASKRQSEVRQ